MQYGKCIEDIAQYLDESKALGTWKIYTSTLMITEIPKSRLKSSAAFATFRDFLDDYRDVVIAIPSGPEHYGISRRSSWDEIHEDQRI
jgi:hypothetical protein